MGSGQLLNLFARELSHHQGQPTSRWYQLHLVALSGFGTWFPDDILDVKITFHVGNQCLKHPVGGLLSGVSRHLIDTDYGIYCYRSFTPHFPGYVPASVHHSWCDEQWVETLPVIPAQLFDL
jgi:hypothetical protein